MTIALGWTDFTGIAEEPIVRVVLPLQFGLPQFYLIPCLTMCLVVTIVFIEATGMFLALGAMTGRKVDADDVKRGLRADSLGTVIGAIFNTFPYVSYSQNIGLVGVTGVYSRWVCVAGGVIMLVLGLIPKLAFIVASVPQCVLGGAGFIMFGMVAATGIKILSTVDYAKQRNSVLVVAISIGFGLIPIVAADILPRLSGRAEADLRRRHHPDVDRGRAAQRVLQPHQPGTGRGRDVFRRAGGRAHLTAGGAVAFGGPNPALQPDAAGLNAGEERRVEANEGALRGVVEPHRIARRWVEPLAFEIRAGLLERRCRCEAIGEAQKQRARVWRQRRVRCR